MKTSLPSNFFAVSLYIPLAILCAFVPVARGQVSFSAPPTYSASGNNIFVADFNGKPGILTAELLISGTAPAASLPAPR
jgi:hypothetical protein